MKQKLISFYEDKKILSSLLIGLFIAFILVTFMVSMSSWIYPLSSTNAMVNDGNIFFYIGQLLNQGKTPYVEVFDHKGLYLFYYVTLGTIGNSKYMLYFLQIIFFGISNFFLILTLREYDFKFLGTVSTIFLLTSILLVSQQSVGDYEVQFPFLCMMQYFFFRGLKNHSDKDYYISAILMGICAGVAINVRASDAMVSFAFFVALFVLLVKEKQYKEMFSCVGLTLISLIIISLPPYLHALCGGFFNDMFEATIIDNFRYVGMDKDTSYVLLMRILIGLLVVIFVVLIFLNRKKISKDEIICHSISLGIMCILQLILAQYPHYLFICLPYFIFTLVRLLSLFNFKKYIRFSFQGLSFLFLLGAAIYVPTSYYLNDYQKAIDIKEFVDAKISKEDKKGHTLALDCSCAIYTNSEICVSYGDFSVQTYHTKISKRFSKENLESYILSSDSHFIITDANEKEEYYIYMNSLAQTLIYEKVDSTTFSGGKYISIWRHIV